MKQNVNSTKNKIVIANEPQEENISLKDRTDYAAQANTHLAALLTSDKRYISIETTQLRNSWQYSRDIIKQATNLLRPLHSQYPAIHSVVLAGSFGRMEGGIDSDFDFFVIAQDGAIQNRQDETDLFELVWQQLKTLPVAPPDRNGIFTRVTTPCVLCDKSAHGNLDYARHVFGLRIQLLTDSQPLYGSEALQQLQTNIIRWYCQPDYSPFSGSALQYFLADLKRYYASYAIWHQYRFDKTFNDSWLMRQIKMHHSRLASFAALAITAINIASDHQSNNNQLDEKHIASELAKQLKLTPLERLLLHWPEDQHTQLTEYLSHYNRIAALISDPKIRQLLINENPEAVRYKAQGFKKTETPEPVLNEIIDSIEHLRSILTLCVNHTVSNSNSATASCWSL